LRASRSTIVLRDPHSGGHGLDARRFAGRARQLGMSAKRL
jgi:hypothetical protein